MHHSDECRQYTGFTQAELADLLSGFGADQHSERAFAVETLPEESFHFRERSKEHQISIYGKQLLPYFQTGHLK